MVDLKEEQKYDRLRKLAQELHIPMPEAFWTLEVFDKDGKLIRRHRQRSHSWTRNAYNELFGILAGKDLDDITFGAGKLSLKTTAGVVESGNVVPNLYLSSYDIVSTYGYRAAAGDDTYGILVGSGVNVESFEDYVLQTPIADGTGDGELNHIESEAHAISYADTTLTNTLIRYFNNNSGGNVDVNEVALCMSFRTNPALAVMSRDKLASTVTVPDTGQLKVSYTIQLTYPA